MSVEPLRSHQTTKRLSADDIIALARRLPIQPKSFTISQWCEMRGYSRIYFYTLRKTGDAPDVIGTGKAQRITDAADKRWVKRQEQKAKKERA